MSSWIVPTDVRELLVFADNDVNFAGQAAAFTLAHRIKRTDLTIRIEVPPTIGLDWNDIHQQQRKCAA
jgi:putative DNA primase/helicase